MTGSKRLRFLHPGPLDRPTGGSVYDRRIVEELRALGWTVTVRELPGRFPEADDEACAAAVHSLKEVPDGESAVIDGLALPAFEGLIAEAARRMSLTAIVHHPVTDETGLTEPERLRFENLEKALLAPMRRVIVPSPAMARRLANFGVAPHRIAVAQPGVEREARARAAGSAGETVQLLCVASLIPRKGHAALLVALARCKDLNWRLACVGSTDHDPETAASVRAGIDRLGLADRVTLTGALRGAALEDAFASADAFALATYYEGFGMVFAEAMARGLPIVASGAGAVPDTVPQQAGVVVPAGDEDALAEALRRMIADPVFRKVKADGSWRAGRDLPGWSASAARFAAALCET